MLKTLDAFIDENYGKKETLKRGEFEEGYEEFKIGILLQEARLKKGLTQEQLAENVAPTKRIFPKLKIILKTFASQL